jgi:hypothetical protein
MKEFWSDYGDLCTQQGEFYKEHWKGMIILSVALVGVAVGYMAIATHQDEIKEFFTKKKNVEEVEAN